MTKLKTLSIAAATAAALTAVSAAPSLAQPWRDHGPVYERQLTTSYVDSLDWRINNAARMGHISWRTAENLRADLRRVQPIAWRVETGRASRGEYMRLARTVDRIEAVTNTYAMERPRYYYRR